MAPVENPTGDTVLADDSESEPSVNVINAGNALWKGGGDTSMRVSSPTGSSSTIVSIARSAASLIVSQALRQLPEDDSASFTTISSYAYQTH